MSPIFTCVIPVQAVPKERARVVNGRAYTPQKTRAFERFIKAYVRAELLKQRKLNLTRKKSVYYLNVVFFLKRPKSVTRKYPNVKPDCSNLVKAIEDALNGILWLDDSEIIDLGVRKRYAESKPHIAISLFIVE